MVDAAEVVVADEGRGGAVAAREAVLAEVAMEIEEDLTVLLVVAQVIVLTNGLEAAVVSFKTIFDQCIVCHYIHIKLCDNIDL